MADDDVLRLVTCFVPQGNKTNMIYCGPTPLLDVVALIEDLPLEGGRARAGRYGVEILGPGAFEVEFIDDEGRAYAELALRESELLSLHYRPQQAA